jgi:hypothetical protein
VAARVNAAVAAGARTSIQSGAGWAVTEALNAFHIVDMDPRQYGISVLILTAVFSFLQNNVENGIGKAFLKKLPEGGRKATVPTRDKVVAPE